jgi:hypothetical protein
VTEWQSADDRNGREKVTRARQAAEDLFKPAQQNTGTDLVRSTPSAASSAEPQSRREPRIFAVPPRAPISAPVESPAKTKPIRRRAVTRRETRAVPASQMGRVRALTSYGMTRAQVAELYDVSIDEIERIIRGPVYSGKSR